MSCPRCHADFVLQDLFTGGRHATVAACAACGGQWMRKSDLERLSEVVVPVVVEWRPLPDGAEQRVPLHCPDCEGAPALEKLHSERDARVVFDLCRTCSGVFLDRGELRAIQEEPLLGLLINVSASNR